MKIQTKLQGLTMIEVSVADEDLGQALFSRAKLMCQFDDDDTGSEWLTDEDGNTYIAVKEWKVSSNPQVAALIDAYHVLCGRGIRRLQEEAGA